MEFIPLITLQKGKIVENISEKLDEFKKLYVLDLDGIEKGKPNFDIYQKLSTSVDLWVDNGPRNIGDVVDTFMAGATDITIRRGLCPNLKISDIRDVSDNKIYANIDFEKLNELDNDMFFYDVDGLVNLIEKDRIELNLEYSKYLNKARLGKKIYSYEPNPKNLSFWAGFNIEGLLVDIKNFKEFKNGP
jgi:uncharacterized protein related to proFAR isomerase